MATTTIMLTRITTTPTAMRGSVPTTRIPEPTPGMTGISIAADHHHRRNGRATPSGGGPFRETGEVSGERRRSPRPTRGSDQGDGAEQVETGAHGVGLGD